MQRRTLLALLALVGACHGDVDPTHDGAVADSPTDSVHDAGRDGGSAPRTPDTQTPPATTGDDIEATSPAPGTGTWTEAPVSSDDAPSSVPAFGAPIRYVARPGAVIVQLPKVEGAGDYRVYALSDDVKVSTQADGSEHVTGATIACAGLVQRNQCDESEALSGYGPNFRVASCREDLRAVNVPKAVAQQVQVDGLRAKTRLVVEAIDALCPFPGAYGARHVDVRCYADGVTARQATYQGQTVQWRTCPASVPVRTEAEIRSAYGSLILNGQGPATTSAGESPWGVTGLPAPARDPKVLRRSVIEVEPLPAHTLPAGFTESDFFVSFSDPADQPRKVSEAGLVPDYFGVQNPTLHQTSQLNLYSYAAEDAQWFVAQGTLRTVLPDLDQNIMASSMMVPKRAFSLPSSDERYVHVTFEAPTNATQRRYWWFYACGAEQAGKTIVDGKLAAGSAIVPQPGFMNPLEGYAVSTRGWNCLQIVPRNGSYERVSGGVGRPETDLRIVINPAVSAPRSYEALRGAVVNVSPSMLEDEDASLYGTWLRQWDATKKITGVLLDDQLYVEQRVVFDVYFNRKRIVLFAGGVQKLCNDYTRHRLTMAEAALGVGHVLYHSSAEREDLMREDWLTTGQFHYLHNLSMLDQRSFDNYGVREGVQLPSSFVEGQCYDAKD